MNNVRAPAQKPKASILTALFIVLLLSIASTTAVAAKGESQGKGPNKPTTVTFDAPFPYVRGVFTCGLGPDGCASKSYAKISTSGEFELFAFEEPTVDGPNVWDSFATFEVPLRHVVKAAHSKVEWTMTMPIDLARANLSALGLLSEASVKVGFNVTSTLCGTACPSANIVVRQAQAILGEDRDEGPALVEIHVVYAAANGTKLAAGQYDFAVLVRARALSAATLDGAVDFGAAEAFVDGRLDSVRMAIYP